MANASLLSCDSASVHPFAVPPSQAPLPVSAGQTLDNVHNAYSQRKETKCSVQIGIELNRCSKDCKVRVFMVMLLLITLGTITSFIWNIVEKGQQINYYKMQNGVFEKEIKSYVSRIDILEKELSASAPTTDLNPSTSMTTMLQSKRMFSFEDTTATTTTTATLSNISISPIITSQTVTPKTMSVWTAFQVIQTAETTYRGFNFLAVEMEIPSDGLSVSENWCRDYENLCKQFSRRPTGCGVSYVNTYGFKQCAEEYNSDMNITDILLCSPATHISIAVNAAFPSLSFAATNENSFGFLSCLDPNCQNTIQQSEYGLSRMRAFWQQNATTMYTLCR